MIVMDPIVIIPALDPDEKLQDIVRVLHDEGVLVVLVDDGSASAAQAVFAAHFEQLDYKAAHNLDGGPCSFMTKNDRVANDQYKPTHEDLEDFCQDGFENVSYLRSYYAPRDPCHLS